MARRLAATLTLTALAATAALAQSDAYPARPIRVLVPNTPASAADVVARYVAQQLGEAWKQPVTVENRAGAGGIVAVDTVAKSAPDGYTLLQAADGPITILPSLGQPLPYQPLKDLVPIA